MLREMIVGLVLVAGTVGSLSSTDNASAACVSAKADTITVNGKSYEIVRVIRTCPDIKSNHRNYNFSMDVKKGEKILAVEKIKGDPSKEFRLKRDKRGKFGAKDKNVRKPLKHGDVWEAHEDYTGYGDRLYIKHENGFTAEWVFYVVK